MEPDRDLVRLPDMDAMPLPMLRPADQLRPAGQPRPSQQRVSNEAVVADGEVWVAPTDTFSDFYRESRDRIVRALAVTIGDRDLAVEAVDEAMARAYQRWAKVGSIDNPAGWVYRVACNWATSGLRRRARAPRPPVAPDVAGIGPISEPDIAVALLELDVRQRAVVVCRYFLGWSEAETAAALATPPGTVKSRLHRATRHLATRLAHLRPEENDD